MVSFIRTFSGRCFHIDRFSPEDVELNDIVLGLFRMVRWSGQTKERWNVLQHSMLVAQAACELRGWNAALTRAALLHDASEAYLGDQIAPLKQRTEGGRKIHTQFDQVIFQAFGVQLSVADHDLLNLLDKTAALVEYRYLQKPAENDPLLLEFTDDLLAAEKIYYPNGPATMHDLLTTDGVELRRMFQALVDESRPLGLGGVTC